VRFSPQVPLAASALADMMKELKMSPGRYAAVPSIITADVKAATVFLNKFIILVTSVRISRKQERGALKPLIKRRVKRQYRERSAL